jgi:hypothetical protein
MDHAAVQFAFSFSQYISLVSVMRGRIELPWETTEQYIRSGHRDAEEFQKDTLKTITLNEKEGIKAVVGKPKGKHSMEVQSYLFEKDKGWTVEKAKAWFEKHHNPAKEHVYAVLTFTIT